MGNMRRGGKRNRFSVSRKLAKNVTWERCVKNIGTRCPPGPRMNSRISVAIEWNPAPGSVHFEEGFTRVVNGYGCLPSSPQENSTCGS